MKQQVPVVWKTLKAPWQFGSWTSTFPLWIHCAVLRAHMLTLLVSVPNELCDSTSQFGHNRFQLRGNMWNMTAIPQLLQVLMCLFCCNPSQSKVKQASQVADVYFAFALEERWWFSLAALASPFFR